MTAAVDWDRLQRIADRIADEQVRQQRNLAEIEQRALYVMAGSYPGTWAVCWTDRGCAVPVAEYDSPQRAEDKLRELQAEERAT